LTKLFKLQDIKTSKNKATFWVVNISLDIFTLSLNNSLLKSDTQGNEAAHLQNTGCFPRFLSANRKNVNENSQKTEYIPIV